MASILTISKEFFSFTNILVNDFKAELMTTAKLTMITNSNGVSSSAPITFTTGLSSVTLTPKLHHSSVRYLGVWINLNKLRTFVLNQCKKKFSSAAAFSAASVTLTNNFYMCIIWLLYLA